MNKNKKRVLIELSGGVDSAVCAYLLKKQGYECIGAMMLLHKSTGYKAEIESARNICKKLEIPFELFDFREKFYNDVISYFINTYIEAKTPNPCIVCNKKMKFGIMFDVAKNLNCEKIATGHYARIIKNDKFVNLYCAKDKKKDQSYVLHFLNQNQLSKIILPLGNFTKEEIRKIAEDAGFECARKEESQDICFIEDGDYVRFIKNNSNYKDLPGDIVDVNGKTLGRHKGLINYTIGQRKGLGLAFGEPKYVLKLDSESNQVILDNKEHTMQEYVEIIDFNWIDGCAPSSKFECGAKLRYRQKQVNCVCEVKNDSLVNLYYPNKISAVTPGQFAVLYNNDKVLGGGTII